MLAHLYVSMFIWILDVHACVDRLELRYIFVCISHLSDNDIMHFPKLSGCCWCRCCCVDCLTLCINAKCICHHGKQQFHGWSKENNLLWIQLHYFWKVSIKNHSVFKRNFESTNFESQSVLRKKSSYSPENASAIWRHLSSSALFVLRHIPLLSCKRFPHLYDLHTNTVNF